MLNTQTIKPSILIDLREAGIAEDRLKTMTPEEVLVEWLRYEGIIGYAGKIVYMLDNLRQSQTVARQSRRFTHNAQ